MRRAAAAVAVAVTAVLAGTLALAVAPGCRFNARTRGDVFSAALSFQRSGDVALASALWRRLLLDHPDDADALMHLAECEELLGHVDEAVAAWRRYVELRPAEVPAVARHLSRMGMDPEVLRNRPGGEDGAGDPDGGGAGGSGTGAAGTAAGTFVDLTGTPPPPPLGGKHVDAHLAGADAPRGTYYPGGGAAPGGVLGGVLPTRVVRAGIAAPGVSGKAGAGGAWALAVDDLGERFAYALPGGGLRVAAFGGDGVAAGVGAGSGAGASVTIDAGRGGAALAVAFSSAPARVAWGSADGKVRVHDLRGARVAVLSGHAGPVRAVAIEADAARVHAAGDDATLRTWLLAPEGASGPRLERTGTLPGRPTALALSPGARWLAVALADGRVLLVDPWSGRLEATLRDHAGRATAVAFTADGRHLVSGGWDGTARVYHTGSWEPVGAHALHPDVVTSVAGGARVFVTASGDGRVKVVEAHGGVELLQLPGHRHEVEAVATSLDGRRVVSLDWSGEVRFWELR